MSPPTLPIRPRRLRHLLTRLLDIYSPSGKEQEATDFLHGYFRRRGMPVIRQAVDENRDNLVLAPGGPEAAAAFIGHIDTVTAYDFEDFGSEEDGDRITGLGAADMKGGCAAMIEAFTCLWEEGLTDVPLTLALVVGEEELGDGAETLVRDYRFPWAIIGEPTALKPCLSHYGYLEIQLATNGRRLHASLAQRGQNAVESMLRILLRLTSYLEQQRTELVYNVRDLFSSRAGFVVPDRCEAWVDVHLPPSAPIAEITMEMEELLELERRENPSVDATIHFDTLHAGYILPEKGPVVESLKKVYAARTLEWSPIPFPSHSDANQLWMNGVKPIMLGCGELDQAHTPDESIHFSQVLAAAEIYYQFARQLIRELSPPAG